MYAAAPPGNQPEPRLSDARWRNYRDFNTAELPDSTRGWLLDNGSLTQRLVNASKGQLKVEVLFHDWQLPRPSEIKLLDMQADELAIVREVVLHCFDQPWVFARSILPSSSLTGPMSQLRTLDDSPLGALLFSDPTMQRQPFELIRLAGNDPQLPASLHSSDKVWGRRCRFELTAKPIMVSEFFLPAFRA